MAFPNDVQLIMNDQIYTPDDLSKELVASADENGNIKGTVKIMYIGIANTNSIGSLSIARNALADRLSTALQKDTCSFDVDPEVVSMPDGVGTYIKSFTLSNIHVSHGEEDSAKG